MAFEAPDVLQFSLSQSNSADPIEVLNAHMFVLVKYKKKADGVKNPARRVKITIYNIPSHNGDYNEEELDYEDDEDYQEDGYEEAESHVPQGQLITSIDVDVKHTRWQKLILPVSVIQDVLNSSSGTLQFRVECKNCGNEIQPVLVKKPKRRTREGGRHSTKKIRLHKRRPFLLIHTRHSTQSSQDRVRRNTHHCPPSVLSQSHVASSSTQVPCTVNSMYITFRQLGWDDWILSPEGYYANYCKGGCEQPADSPQHCCRPASTSALEVFHLTESGQIVQRYLDGMIVNSCSCSYIY